MISFTSGENTGTVQKAALTSGRFSTVAGMVLLCIGLEGDINVYVGHRGQTTKCAREHVRKASTLEQLSFEGWFGFQGFSTLFLWLSKPMPAELEHRSGSHGFESHSRIRLISF